MRSPLIVILIILVSSNTIAAGKETLEPRSSLSALGPGELKVEIHSPSIDTDLVSTTGEMSVEVEGVASTIGGVRFIDMMLVLDTSTSLRQNDPDEYRTTAAVGLIESLSPKSDTKIGVIGFNGDSDLIQPLTADRDDVVQALKNRNDQAEQISPPGF